MAYANNVVVTPMPMKVLLMAIDPTTLLTAIVMTCNECQCAGVANVLMPMKA